MRLGSDVRPGGRTVSRSTRQRRPAPLRFEPLEGRVVLSVAATSAVFQPTFVRVAADLGAAGGISPAVSASEITPSVMRSAYGVTKALFGTVVGDGTGETIAIVNAYNQPNIQSDLAAFDSKYGLPAPPSFKQFNQTGGPASRRRTRPAAGAWRPRWTSSGRTRSRRGRTSTWSRPMTRAITSTRP